MPNNELSKNIPLVSAVMAVKNGSDYIRQSLTSVIHQTFSDFELIVINDGSEDDTLAIVEGLKDSRIRIYSQNNRGVARSANRGLALAKGKYIARIDHDDIWFPERLEKQVKYLNENPDVALVGAAAVIWIEDKPTGRYLDHPVNSADIRWQLLFDNPFVHSSIIFRKELIKKIGLYHPGPDITPLDDYHFISRVACQYKVANLAERLVAYRETSQSLTSNFRETSEEKYNSLKFKLVRITSENIAKLNKLPLENGTCINLARTINETTSSVSFLHLLRMEKLLVRSAKVLQHDKELDIDKLLEFRINDLRWKWFKNLSHSRRFSKALYVARDMYLCCMPVSLIKTKKYNSLTAQYISTKYWAFREGIYHKLYIGHALVVIRKLRARIKNR